MPSSGPKATPINPQDLRVNQKRQKRKHAKQSSTILKVNEGSAKDDSQAVSVIPSKDMKELKEDIIKKNILSNLSTEIFEQESTDSLTAIEPPTIPQQLSIEPLKQRLLKLDEISLMTKDFTSKFEKFKKEVDDWNIKYRKRVVDMHLDVGGYEKKVKKKCNVEKTRVSEVQVLGEYSLQKRQWIARGADKMMIENPEKTVITRLLEYIYNAAQSVLWTLAIIRDFFSRR